jgi:hypothetical protein
MSSFGVSLKHSSSIFKVLGVTYYRNNHAKRMYQAVCNIQIMRKATATTLKLFSASLCLVLAVKTAGPLRLESAPPSRLSRSFSSGISPATPHPPRRPVRSAPSSPPAGGRPRRSFGVLDPENVRKFSPSVATAQVFFQRSCWGTFRSFLQASG